MAGFSTDRVADTLAATLVDAVKNGWLKVELCHAIVDDFAGHAPLADSGKKRFVREAYNKLGHHAWKCGLKVR